LPEEGRSRLTDPYVTNRRKGTGLGLAIVMKIVEQHGGELVLGDAPETSELDGAQVTLRLPKPAVRAQSGNPDSDPELAPELDVELGPAPGVTGGIECGENNG
jgi:two-component system nitrogen regulation sensor histidine kinase NtrY